ncbi:MAG: glycerophosphodiester phosphodiesterase [Candidatus Sericytochromatia bacterium]|nr:glycerophosphodiester phosphodiesterase [Candidatus Tanganyikabacteria bacterium]
MVAVRRYPARPYVVGHRGAAGHAPENTLSAFAAGARMGADLVECDVHLSRDGEVVVFHDDTLERTTGAPGLLRDHDLDALRRLDAGRGERIPTLAELLAFAAGRPPLGVVVEIKNGPYFYPDIARKVATAIARYGMADRALVISFDNLVVREFKEIAPHVATGILFYARLADPAGAARAAGADCIWPALPMLTPDVVRQAHAAGLGVFTWTANSQDDFSRALEAGVDGIGSDFPDALAARLPPSSPPGRKQAEIYPQIGSASGSGTSDHD